MTITKTMLKLVFSFLTHSLSEHIFFPFHEKVSDNQHLLIKAAFVLEFRDVSMNQRTRSLLLRACVLVRETENQQVIKQEKSHRINMSQKLN